MLSCTHYVSAKAEVWWDLRSLSLGCVVLDEKDGTYFWRGSRVALIPGSMELEGPGMMQQQHVRQCIYPPIRGSRLAAYVACSLEHTAYPWA
jgi:hypothetical protein